MSKRSFTAAASVPNEECLRAATPRAGCPSARTGSCPTIALRPGAAPPSCAAASPGGAPHPMRAESRSPPKPRSPPPDRRAARTSAPRRAWRCPARRRRRRWPRPARRGARHPGAEDERQAQEVVGGEHEAAECARRCRRRPSRLARVRSDPAALCSPSLGPVRPCRAQRYCSVSTRGLPCGCNGGPVFRPAGPTNDDAVGAVRGAAA